MICGVDEAGKGAVLGPLVIAAAGCASPEELEGIGIRDSKELSPSRREELFPVIIERCSTAVLSVPSADVDRHRLRMNLNRCMARGHAAVINRLAPSVAYIDACDVNAERYAHMVREYLACNCSIISQHHADTTYPVVSAASIVAKVVRDRAIAELSDEYGDIGSGYPSDGKTIAFLRAYIKSNKKNPPIARKGWSTVTSLLNEEFQVKITRFFGP